MHISPIQNYNNYTINNKMNLVAHQNVTYRGGWNEMSMALDHAIERAREPLNRAEKKYEELLKDTKKSNLVNQVTRLQEQIRELYDQKLFTEIDGLYKKIDILKNEIADIDKKIEQAKENVTKEKCAYQRERQKIEENPWSYI